VTTRRIGNTDLHVHPLALGGNVFGWTADRDASFEILDGYARAGGNFIDTSENYTSWVEGNRGGESETIIGAWLATQSSRSDFVISTKIKGNLTPDNIRRRAVGCLQRLQTDYIDIFYIHYDDPDTPLEETLAGYDALVREGLIRHVAISNMSVDRLAEVLAIVDRHGFAPVVAFQAHYNLVEREPFESVYRPLCAERRLAVFSFWALASGFLTGKYRPGVAVESARIPQAAPYLENPHALATLDVLDDIATARETALGAVALAWLVTQPTIVAATASARTIEQLNAMLSMAELRLTEDELTRLDAASLGTSDLQRSSRQT
jgi:aryl-alcohol dehydrogenase-like predicted oxidoreductase